MRASHLTTPRLVLITALSVAYLVFSLTMRETVGDDVFERTVEDADKQGRASGPGVFRDGKPLPKLMVFDLDYTLWPFWVDTHVSPPLKAGKGNTSVKDRSNDHFTFYPDVPSILYSAHALRLPLALASRTSAPDLAQKMLKLLHVPTPAAADPRSAESSSTAPVQAWNFFDFKEIYPGDKRTHLKRLHEASGVAYEDMVFFDDEQRNSNVKSLGVFFWLVPDGVTNAEVDRAVGAWRKQRAGVEA